MPTTTHAAVLPEVPSESKASPLAVSVRWLYLLFFLSGISGLMYEVVWVRMLTRILGSTVYATSTVLATFMAGLVVGSFLMGRFIDRSRRPLYWYALLELGIGLSALASLALPDRLLPVYQAIYDFARESRAGLRCGQVLITLCVLLAPTALMGATLPALSAYGARHGAAFGRYVGTLYGVNTLGAVLGVVYSGFFLIGEVGETRTLELGVALNVAVAAAAVLLGRRVGAAPVANAVAPGEIPAAKAAALYPAGLRRLLLACFGMSGLVALANEVIWSRMLVLHQGTSIYAFSSMLAVVLAGMGLGSFVGGKLVHRAADPLRLLARLQLAVGLFQAIALHLFVWQRPGYFWAPVILLGPLGLLWGLAFPVGAICYLRAPSAAGRSIAALYLWNTLGCIAGALGAGFVLIPLLGVSRSVALLAVVSTLVGMALLGKHPQGFRSSNRWLEWSLAGTCALLLVSAGDPYYRLLERRMLDFYPGGVAVEQHIEEAAATTTAFARVGGSQFDKQLWVNGTGMTHLNNVTKMMAHLPIALTDDPHDVLVVCLGMGTTARSASRHEGLHIHIVELIPGVLKSFGYFHADAPSILRQPNVHAHVDDGRNYLLMHKQQYDVITIDPPPPLYSAGAVNLYSREFFQLCLERLRPGGAVCLWIPPDKYSEIKMIMRTYVEVFENIQVWSGPPSIPGYLLVGSGQPLHGMAQRIQRLYRDPSVAADLREWGPELAQPDNILDLYVGDDRQLRRFVTGARVITDDCPYTEFPLWRSLEKGGAYHRILAARPVGLKDPGD